MHIIDSDGWNTRNSKLTEATAPIFYIYRYLSADLYVISAAKWWKGTIHTTNYCSIWYTLEYIRAKETVDIFSQAFSGKSTITFLFIWLLEWQNWDWLFGAVAKFPETGIPLMLWQVKGSCPLLCRNWVTRVQATNTSVVVLFDLNMLCYESFWCGICLFGDDITSCK